MKKNENKNAVTTEEQIGYRQIFTQKEYCKLILSNIINRFGDSIDALAFTWLVYQATGSASWSAIIFALNMIPSILLQPLAGAFVERRNKKKLMIISDMLRGCFIVVLVLVYVTGHINPWMLAIFTICISSVEAFCVPASTAIIPKLLEKKYYEFGTSLNTAASRVMELAGTAVAGIIIGVFGVGVAILIDAATFFVSAAIKMFLRVEENLLEQETTQESATKQYLADLKGGFAYIKTKKIVMNFCIMAFFINAMLAPFNSLESPLVIEVLQQGSELLSVMGMAFTIGMGIATVIFPYLSRKCRVANFICVTGIGEAVSLGMLTMGSHFIGNDVMVYVVTALACFSLGFFIDLLNCEVSVQFMKSVEPEYLARTTALLGAGAMAAIPISSFLISILVKYFGVKEIIIISSIISVVIFGAVRLLNVKVEEEDAHGNENNTEESY